MNIPDAVSLILNALCEFRRPVSSVVRPLFSYSLDTHISEARKGWDGQQGQ